MSERDGVLKSIENLRSRVGQVHRRLTELHETASFDPRLPNLPERAKEIESEVQSVGGDAERLRERFEELHGNQPHDRTPRRRKTDRHLP